MPCMGLRRASRARRGTTPVALKVALEVDGGTRVTAYHPTTGRPTRAFFRPEGVEELSP